MLLMSVVQELCGSQCRASYHLVRAVYTVQSSAGLSPPLRRSRPESKSQPRNRSSSSKPSSCSCSLAGRWASGTMAAASPGAEEACCLCPARRGHNTSHRVLRLPEWPLALLVLAVSPAPPVHAPRFPLHDHDGIGVGPSKAVLHSSVSGTRNSSPKVCGSWIVELSCWAGTFVHASWLARELISAPSPPRCCSRAVSQQASSRSGSTSLPLSSSTVAGDNMSRATSMGRAYSYSGFIAQRGTALLEVGTESAFACVAH